MFPESLRDENEKLCQELDELLTAYKQVKQAVDRLRSDYELARRAVLFRQYTMLKSAVKRAAMLVRLQADQGANVSEVHLELNGSIKTSTFAKAGNKRSEAQRKREERRKGALISHFFSFVATLNLAVLPISGFPALGCLRKSLPLKKNS